MGLLKTKATKYIALCGIIFLFPASFASAESITFDFRFEQGGGSAVAVGYITFERSLLPNPGSGPFVLPDPAVLGLSITVSGASSGNGTFGIETFASVIWDTYGATLDLSRELVGQPTADDPWGTDSCNGGDFNFTRVAGSDAPFGVFCFALCTGEGDLDCMVLTSMIARGAQPVPTLNTWGFVALALTLAALAVIRYRRRIV